MKRTIVLCFTLLASILCAMSAGQPSEPTRGLTGKTMYFGNIWMRTSNFGFLGSGDDFVPQYPSLEYPGGSGIDFLYQAAPWISAKKNRRNALGEQLYWLSNNPAETNYQVISQSSPEWTPDKIAVVDSLTSVGFDGDADLFELLPAYNPLLAYNPLVSDMYALYNSYDTVLDSFFGYPAPRPFAVPDPQGTYCFSIPQENVFDTPGFQTHSAYYYDYCPFGTSGERDYGSSASSNHHKPLNIAVHQESYAWNMEQYQDMIIIRYDVYNTSEVDTLFDVALSAYFDADIGPQAWGAEKATDDKSGYISGDGYNFAYSYDADHDGGLSSGIVANKIYIPEYSGNATAWYWAVGHGPDDSDPLNPNPYQLTANEKYWLATGRNPDVNSILSLCPQGSTEYEQPVANDTRFLNTLYGNQPTPSNPNPTGRLAILPGEHITYFSVVFCAQSIPELKNLSVCAEQFIDSGLDVGNVQNMTFVPILTPITIQNPNTFVLTWISGNNPDHFQVMYKPYDAPASQWQIVNKPGDARSHNLSGLSPTVWYEIKVASIYHPGAEEVYLESTTQLVNFENISPNDDPLSSPSVGLCAYPNPCKQGSTISFTLKEAAQSALYVYNLKGQRVRTIMDSPLSPGSHTFVWDAKDDWGKPCSSGIYFLRFSHGTHAETEKLLLLK